MIKRIFPILLTITFLWWTSPAAAQDPTPTPTATLTPTPQPATGPIYIIQPGDGLSSIASKFGVTLSDLMAANDITDANNISAGVGIIIPGLDGVTGILDTEIIKYGDTLHSISRRNQIPEDLLRKLNHITSPSELYAGVSLVYPRKDDFTPLSNRINLEAGETLLEASVRAQTDPWTLVAINGLKGARAAMPGDVLYTGGEAPAGSAGPNGMPSALINVTVSPLPMVQGGTSEIIVETLPGVTLGGMLVDKPLHFFPLEGTQQVALQGTHAMLEPGPHPLTLEATLPDGSKQSFEQMVVVKSADFFIEKLVVDPAMIDPVVTEPELAQLVALVAPATAQRYWQNVFKSPASQFPDGLCLSSRFGNIRSYNNGPFDAFHTGVDFCGGTGLPITAPAEGVVIFAGPLTVRGNATVIDHGWGVYSGFWHQSEIDVQVGQHVQTGDIIGLVGGTGRITGPHLHWEVWVNGVQVNPIDWLENTYP